jgi:hypothetical protein
MPPLLPTARQALLTRGATPADLDLDLRAGRSLSVFRGVHVDAGHADGFWVRLRAALATQDVRAIATLTTAAVLHGFRWLPVEWLQPHRTIHLAVGQDAARRHRVGIRLHRRLLRPEDVTVVDGIPCFTPTRTLVELAREPHIAPLVVVQILDGALRDRRTSKAELLSCLASMPGERGVARARLLVGRARDGVDSPRETELRWNLEMGGVEGIDVNLEIRDEPDGIVLARGDLGSWRFLVWGEYDGYEEHTKRKTFRGDRVGDRWLTRRGWHIMRFVDEDLRRGPALGREWQQAIATAPARMAGLKPSASPELAQARRLLGLDR